MNNQVLGIEINKSGIGVAMVDIDTNTIVSGTAVRRDIDSMETVDNLTNCWTDAIKQSHKLNLSEVSLIGIAIPGAFDYVNGVSLMKDQGKFDALYNLNVKDLLAKKLEISPLNIRMENNTTCFLHGEITAGSAQGYNNVLGFTINEGLGSARYVNGSTIDANLWSAHFKDGIAEDFLDSKWLTNRYEEFTGLRIDSLSELKALSKTDDGIGELVFNEYSENFVTFVIQYIQLYDSDMVVLGGGFVHAWDLIIRHIKDRLNDKKIYIPVRQAVPNNDGTLIGAASLWK